MVLLYVAVDMTVEVVVDMTVEVVVGVGVVPMPAPLVFGSMVLYCIYCRPIVQQTLSSLSNFVGVLLSLFFDFFQFLNILGAPSEASRVSCRLAIVTV